ncbi:regulatory LuxR family protein [Haloactinopolyspora alba]|uniref:Regulatory LuxR family protein n=1 Tax=Haloactinopolyspora alba TaxID=648780 RepID=A0A2P8DXF3_9ACTN|nr:LuxR family transcriptional regulator [Haloactinopolyspora alba]PSL01895.1 regulatory LuxR family protein [Haloactinopolyspora alba]
MAEPADPSPTAPLAWPHVGRSAEYTTALRLLSGTDPAEPPGVLLVGDAGVGKSSIANRVEHALGESAHVVTVLPPGTIQPVMLSALAPLLSSVSANDATSPVAVFRAAAQRLEHDADGRPVVLRVEDCHLLDGASARVLRMLSSARRARLLLTGRGTPALPDDVLALWKDGQLTRIDVEPFDREATSQLLHTALGGVIARETDRRMWDASRGNPLYLRELVRSALSRSELDRGRGVWTWTGPPVPGRLLELVTSELHRLTADQREVLETVSLADSLPLPLLFELTDTTSVDVLVEAGMLTVDQAAAPPTVRLAHPVYGEAIRVLVPPGRRRVLRERVALQLPAPGHASLPDLLRWVAWTLEAGSVPEPALLVDAASLANHLQQAGDAQRYADLALLADAPCDVVAAALAERARANRMLGLIDNAQADLDRFHARPPGTWTSRLVAHAAITGADVRYYGHADVAGAIRLLDEALEHAAGDAPAAADLRAHRLAMILTAGHTGATLADALEFLDDGSLPLLARVRLAAPAQLTLAQTGQVREALRLGDRYVAAARAPLSEATAYLPALRGLAVLLRLFAGDVDDAERLHRDDLDDVVDVAHEPQHRAIPGLVEGRLALARGRWSEAYGHFGVAAAALRERDPLGLLPAVLAFTAEAAVRLGELDDAARQRDESLRTASGVGTAGHGWPRTLLWVGLARREADAVSAALRTADRASAEGLPPAELDALFVAVLGVADGLPADSGVTLPALADRMESVAGHCHGMSRTAPVVRFTRALAAGDAGEIAAAEASLSRHGMWTVVPRDSAVTLTRREQQIAPLAAAGLASRDIAHRLSISTRTVESHLARVYSKLGISSRAELPRALHDGRIDGDPGAPVA